MGWNRQQYYLVFNSALTGLAATLLSQGSTVKQILAMLVFIAGIPACLLGRAAITKGHEYYRQSIYKKTLIEEELGLTKQLVGYTYAGANLIVATTSGMHSVTQILHDTEKWLARPERLNSIISYFRIFLLILLLINFAGAAVSVWLIYQERSNLNTDFNPPATQK